MVGSLEIMQEAKRWSVIPFIFVSNQKLIFSITFLLSFSITATGGVFGPQGESGSEPEDDGQMKFYTEQHRGRRRSKGTSSQLLQGDWFVLSCTASIEHSAPPPPALLCHVTHMWSSESSVAETRTLVLERQTQSCNWFNDCCKNDATAEDSITVHDQIFPSSCNKSKKNNDHDHQEHVLFSWFSTFFPPWWHFFCVRVCQRRKTRVCCDLTLYVHSVGF